MSDRSLREGARRGRGESPVERLAHYQREVRAGRAVPLAKILLIASVVGELDGTTRILRWIAGKSDWRKFFYRTLDDYEEPPIEIREALGDGDEHRGSVVWSVALDADRVFSQWAWPGHGHGGTFAATAVRGWVAEALRAGMPDPVWIRLWQDAAEVAGMSPGDMDAQDVGTAVRMLGIESVDHLIDRAALDWWESLGRPGSEVPKRFNPPYSPEVLQHMREELEETGHPEHVIRTVLRRAVTPPRSFPADRAGADRRAELDRQEGVARRMRNRDRGMLANPRRCYCRWCRP